MIGLSKRGLFSTAAWVGVVVVISGFSMFGSQADASSSSPNASFVPSCQSAAGGLAVHDPEFEPHAMLATWQKDPIVDNKGLVQEPGSVYIAPVDPFTGVILTGSQTVFASTNPAPSGLTKNGPEWGCAQSGCSAYFTSYTTSGTNVRLGKISKAASAWTVSFLPQGDNKGSPVVTLDFASADPALLYYVNTTGDFKQGTFAQSNFGERADTGTPKDTRLPLAVGSGRWVPGKKQLAANVTIVSGSTTKQQIRLLDAITGRSEIVATDLIVADIIVTPFPWQAPEFGGATAIVMQMSSTTGSAQTLRVYRKNNWGAWTIYNTITPPDPAYPVLWSAEPFVFGGHSYLSFAAYQGLSGGRPTGSSQIWIASVDPALSPAIRRKVSVDSNSAKNDPETLAVANGSRVVIYYLDKGTSDSPEDLKLCQTGL